MAEVIDGILIREVETKNIMTKSSLPVGGYSVNPYVGCTHACKYCYASFMNSYILNIVQTNFSLAERLKATEDLNLTEKYCITDKGTCMCKSFFEYIA